MPETDTVRYRWIIKGLPLPQVSRSALGVAPRTDDLHLDEGKLPSACHL